MVRPRSSGCSLGKFKKLTSRCKSSCHCTEALLIDGHQVVFEGSFENINEVQMVTRLSKDIGHRIYLQGRLNHLGSEWRANYIASMLCPILEFLHV